MTTASGDGTLNGSLSISDPKTSLRFIQAGSYACEDPVESVRPNMVGEALISGFSSGSGDGVKILVGGVGSLFFLVGYFLPSGLGPGGSFSFTASLGRVKRSRALNDPLAIAVDPAVAAAFLRRSSASLASLEDPPSSFGRGREGSAGNRQPCLSGGMNDHETSRNHATAHIGDAVDPRKCHISKPKRLYAVWDAHLLVLVQASGAILANHAFQYQKRSFTYRYCLPSFPLLHQTYSWA